MLLQIRLDHGKLVPVAGDLLSQLHVLGEWILESAIVLLLVFFLLLVVLIGAFLFVLKDILVHLHVHIFFKASENFFHTFDFVAIYGAPGDILHPRLLRLLIRNGRHGRTH